MKLRGSRAGIAGSVVIVAGTLVACGRSGGLGTVMSGPAHAFAHDSAPAETGVEIRAFGGATEPRDNLMPNTVGVTARQLGDDREVAIAVGWQIASGRHGGAFARLTANLIEWDRIMGVERLTAGGPSLELGYAPKDLGLCASVSASWDVRLEAPDRGVVAGFLGFCVAGR